MPITFVECDTITDKIEETAAIQREHWEEIARNKEVMVLAPDVEQYRNLERLGMLFAVIVYDGEQIVGYSVNFVSINMHYSALLLAQNDLLFVAKSHRHGRVGMRLIQETERVAGSRGAQMLIWHAKENTPLSTLLPRIGYGVQDILYSRVLPGEGK